MKPRRIVPLTLLCLLACTKKSEPTVSATFVCVRDGQPHALREIGYGWPDAVFSLDLQADERARLTALHNEDLMVVGNAHFVRGWAHIPIKQRSTEWGIGLWVRVSQSDFAALEKTKSFDAMPGTIANQGLYGAPSLGVAAALEPRGDGLRPSIRFTAPNHALTALQENGVSEVMWRQWLSDAFHAGEPEPLGAPFEGTIEGTGWSIYEPEAVGKTAVTFATPPAKKDTLKLLMAVQTADATGNPSIINAGWWVRLDDTSRPALWSGTLASETRVEATIKPGSRIWFKPSQVVQHTPAQAE